MPDDYTRRKDDMILRQPTEYNENYTYTEMDSSAVILNDVTFRRLRLPRREVFAEGVEMCISPRTDSVAVEQNNLTFRRLKLPRRDVSTEREMNCVSVSANCINEDSAASEPNDHFCRRGSFVAENSHCGGWWLNT